MISTKMIFSSIIESLYSQCVRFVPPHPEMFTISYTWGQNILIHINYFHNQRGMCEPEIQFLK